MQTFAELYYTNHGNANFLTSFNLESDHHYFNYSSLCKHFYHLAALTNREYQFKVVPEELLKAWKLRKKQGKKKTEKKRRKEEGKEETRRG